MLIGVDGCDNGPEIEVAYNDPEGVTRDFILEGVDVAGRTLHPDLPADKDCARRISNMPIDGTLLLEGTRLTFERRKMYQFRSLRFQVRSIKSRNLRSRRENFSKSKSVTNILVLRRCRCSTSRVFVSSKPGPTLHNVTRYTSSRNPSCSSLPLLPQNTSVSNQIRLSKRTIVEFQHWRNGRKCSELGTG